MTNRAQRRANNRASQKNGTQGQPEATRSATDQAMFNRRADSVADGKVGEWKPGRVEVGEENPEVSAVRNPNLSRKRTWRDWLRFTSWLLIALSAVTFLVVMWIPNLPIWAIITVSAAFAVGVLSLFVVRGGHEKNPYLDANGTAV